MNKIIGVCCGASSVSYVKLENDNNNIKVIESLTLAHNGNPKDVFLDNLKLFNKEKLPVVVTGRKFRKLVNLKNISEPEATELAFEFINKSKEIYSAIATLGGETFLVYTLDDQGKISNVITKNQCASGTGEFFLQQIKRMNLSLDEVMQIETGIEPHRVSGRCSVFCKSDCTHALNKGIPKSEVATGLAQMMSEKVEELLKKARHGKMLIVGGVTQNHIVMNFLKEKFKEIVIPKEAIYFEALGAALYGLKNNITEYIDFDKVFEDKKNSFVFHKPLEKFKDKVIFKTIEKSNAKDGDRCILGLDVGSTTTKAVILRVSDNKILGSIYLYTLGNPIEASRKCYKDLLSKVPEKIKIIGLGVTGSGRQIAGLHAMTEGVFNEIIAHATAAVYFDPEVDTIFEIGGQDAKYTYIINKVPADYAMNEACSAGTGSFIEESAYESLKIKVTDIESIAMKGANPPNFSDQCAAFISSDIKTALQENISQEDIVAGLVYSICLNYVNRVKGNRPVGKKIFMQGGVCYNKAIPIAMAALTGREIIVPPEPGLMGAYGVALEVKDKIELGILEEKNFDLKELAEREVAYKEPFICAGGREKCDLKCQINLIQIDGKKYPFGGSCNKYYNLLYKREVDNDKFDYVKKRNDLMFGKYAPLIDLPQNTKTIGINQSYQTLTVYPLYYNFFTQLGYKVILSNQVLEAGIDRELTAMCYPGQLSLGLFQDLINKNPDYFFIPNCLEMYVNDAEHHRLDFNTSCIFVSGEPYSLKQAFKDYDFGDRFINPIFNFANGFDKEEEKFIDVARKIGVTDIEKARNAYHYAVKMQTDFQNELYSVGSNFLKELEKNPDELAIVLVGRPYNSFMEMANKGIPQKFASRGVYIIPFDMFDYRNEIIDDDMYWESGKKILKIAKIIKNHPQLYATYISNFSCAPDSMIIPTFRSIMGTKPSLTLELDGHTADAGVNTRIDAALDIISNYKRISHRIQDVDFSDFKLAKITFDKVQGYFVPSDGETVPLSDKKVKLLIPSMGVLSSELFVAGLRSQGFDAEAVREPDSEVLKKGRAVTTGKECLPLIVMVGSLLDYLDNQWDGEQYVGFFIVQGAGNCRLGTYPAYIRNIIQRKRLKNVAIMELMHEDGFAGLGPNFALRGIETLILGDVLDDIRSGIMTHAKEPDKGMQVFNREFNKIFDIISKDYSKFYSTIKNFAKVINKEIPIKIPIKDAKYIALVGEMYVRRDGFSHKWLSKRFAKYGFIIKDAYISEWIFYVDYLLNNGFYEPLKSLKNKLERLIRIVYMRYAEHRIKKIMTKSGYYKFFRTKIEPIVKHGKHIVPLEFKGEPLIIVGTGINYSIEKYCGIISVGPFGCMQTRFAEAVTVPEMKVENKIKIKQMHDPSYTLPKHIFDGKMSLPFLPIETDGNVYPQIIEARLETFLIQAERMAKLMKQFHQNGHE